MPRFREVYIVSRIVVAGNHTAGLFDRQILRGADWWSRAVPTEGEFLVEDAVLTDRLHAGFIGGVFHGELGLAIVRGIIHYTEAQCTFVQVFVTSGFLFPKRWWGVEGRVNGGRLVGVYNGVGVVNGDGEVVVGLVMGCTYERVYRYDALVY